MGLCRDCLIREWAPEIVSARPPPPMAGIMSLSLNWGQYLHTRTSGLPPAPPSAFPDPVQWIWDRNPFNFSLLLLRQTFNSWNVYFSSNCDRGVVLAARGNQFGSLFAVAVNWMCSNCFCVGCICASVFMDYTCVLSWHPAPSRRCCQVRSLAGRANNECSEPLGCTAGLQHARRQGQHKLKNMFPLYRDILQYIRNYEALSQEWFVDVKVCPRGAKRFCHLQSAVRFSAKLLPRMRVNYPHSSNPFPWGCCLFLCLC